MKFIRFWKREKKPENLSPKSQPKEAQKPANESGFAMQSRQKLVLRESQLCLTVPQRAVDTLGINTKRFIEWQRHKQELHGVLLMSETTHTTRIEHLTHKDQYTAIIPESWVNEYGLKSTKDSGPSATCEWNGNTLRIRIPLPHKAPKKKK